MHYLNSRNIINKNLLIQIICLCARAYVYRSIKWILGFEFDKIYRLFLPLLVVFEILRQSNEEIVIVIIQTIA
jgi:hypothetical protein